jgi:hypothetical protein
MDAESNTDNLAEVLLRELRKTTPNVFSGFPTPEELRRRRESRTERAVRLESEREARFQKLKESALASIRKDHP